MFLQGFFFKTEGSIKNNFHPKKVFGRFLRMNPEMENYTFQLYSLDLEYVHSGFTSLMNTRKAIINVDKGFRSSRS